MPSVVVGIDGTEASRQALRWAAAEAELRGTVLRVVHTWSRPYAVSGPNPQPERPEVDEDETERRLAEELFDRELAATGIEATGVRIEPELVEGSPARKLLDAAQHADLLVIGSDRHEKLAATRSVASAENAFSTRLVRSSSCDRRRYATERAVTAGVTSTRPRNWPVHLRDDATRKPLPVERRRQCLSRSRTWT
jgi:nucleotide-binding universal stress UspA family protein